MKLSTRLALAFALVATLPLLAVSPLVLREVRQAFEDEFGLRLEAVARAVEGEERAAADEVVRSLDAVAESEGLRQFAADTRDEWADPAALVPVAGELMKGRGLDVLAILDDDGTVLSSGHLPARVGDPDPQTLALSREAPRKARAEVVEVRSEAGIEKVLALVAARPVEIDGVKLRLLAGRLLGKGFVERLAATSGCPIDLLEGGAIVASAQAPAPAVQPRGSLGLALVPAPQDRTRRLPLPGPAGAEIRAWVSARSLAAAQGRIVEMLAALLLASVALASTLGVVLARRIVRPVEALARGAASVAAGDLGHRVQVRAGGELGELVASFNAMTADLVRERERAAVAERVAAWREVARRLAHEIKNPLTPIAMSVETLRDAWATKNPHLGEIFDESSRAVLEEVARLKRIVDEFSRFARLPPPQLERSRPEELLGPVAALHPDLRTEVEPGLPPVTADRDQVTQVLLNLVQNAEQAMGGEGPITLRARRAAGAVVLEVEDRGPGIPEEALEKIFEPYYTTRENGTGLGLAIARRIAEEHGGTLTAARAPGGGAIFRLRLPAA